jgi:HSP20 family protein
MAGISRWDPFQQLARMQRDFDRVSGRVPSASGEADPAGWMPSVDVEQTRERLVFKFDLPDVTADDVAIELHGRTLTVAGERARTPSPATRATSAASGG